MRNWPAPTANLPCPADAPRRNLGALRCSGPGWSRLRSVPRLGLAVAGTNDLRDIKPPLVIPSGWAWLWWALAAVAVGALLLWSWRRWLKRKAELPPAPVIPAHVRAKQKLQEALALLGRPREFCILVSDTVRWYLEERFDFHAPERTTEEFLYELKGTNLLAPDQKDSLGEFLKSCDLVKFARYEPREPELRDLHAAALRLVEETEPIELSAAPDAPPAPGATNSALDIPHSALR